VPISYSGKIIKGLEQLLTEIFNGLKTELGVFLPTKLNIRVKLPYPTARLGL